MEMFEYLKRKVEKMPNKNRDPKFRQLMIRGMQLVKTPQDAKWLYEQIAENYSTYELRHQALEICFQTIRKFIFNESIDYDYLLWFSRESVNPLRKRWAANTCLLKAKNISQVNDFLRTYADNAPYWRAYINLAENIRQIRQAVKFCNEELRGLAKAIEANMWFKLGLLVPEELPSLK